MFHYAKLPLKQVKSPSDIPIEDHWAILIFETRSQYIEGDERSRTNPGHGYPAHTETHETFQYWAAMNQADLKMALQYLEAQRKKDSYTRVPPYSVIQVRKCSVKTEIHIEVG